MKDIIAKYAERFQDTFTTIREMYCIDFMDVDIVLRDVLDDNIFDEGDYQEVFGKHWRQLNGCDALDAALSIASDNGGWLVFAETASPFNIRFNHDGTVDGYNIGGSVILQHIYAPTLEEALERVALGAEQYLEKVIAAARVKQGISEPAKGNA